MEKILGVDNEYIRNHYNNHYYVEDEKKANEKGKAYFELIDKLFEQSFSNEQKELIEGVYSRLDDVACVHSIELASLISDYYDNIEENVNEYNKSHLGNKLNLLDKEDLILAALFHDTGKIITPPNVLQGNVWYEKDINQVELDETINKKYGNCLFTNSIGTKCGAKEEMNVHSLVVCEVLVMIKEECPNIKNTKLEDIISKDIIDTMRCHHGQKVLYDVDSTNTRENENITINTMVLGIFDSVQAQLTATRPYKEAMDLELVKGFTKKDIDTYKSILEIEDFNFPLSDEDLEDIKFNKIDFLLNDSFVKDKIIEDTKKAMIVHELMARQYIYEHIEFNGKSISFNGEIPKRGDINKMRKDKVIQEVIHYKKDGDDYEVSFKNGEVLLNGKIINLEEESHKEENLFEPKKIFEEFKIVGAKPSCRYNKDDITTSVHKIKEYSPSEDYYKTRITTKNKEIFWCD